MAGTITSHSRNESSEKSDKICAPSLDTEWEDTPALPALRGGHGFALSMRSGVAVRPPPGLGQENFRGMPPGSFPGLAGKLPPRATVEAAVHLSL